MNKDEWKQIIEEESLKFERPIITRTFTDMLVSLEFGSVLDKVRHCIGLKSKGNKGRKYHRHGKCYYKAYRNHYDAGGEDIPIWEALVDLGYAQKNRMYHMTDKGFEWFRVQTGVIVK